MKKALVAYETFMFALIILSLVLAFSEDAHLLVLDRIIWVIFVVDYTVRLLRSEQKWTYVKKHPLELIALIPLDSIFRAARFVRIFRVIRLIGIGSRYMGPVYGLLRTNGLDKLLLVTLVLLFVIPIPIIMVEPHINSFSDALWWAIVTTTTVGYGDISPTTPIGRILAVILMMTGIGIIGTLTSAITTYVSGKQEKTHDEHMKTIVAAIEEADELTEDEIEILQLYLKRKRKVGEE